MKKGPLIVPLSIAHLAGLGAFQIAAALYFFLPRYYYIPLLLFIALCLAAPFMVCFPFFLPVICRGQRSSGSVAITFDDGPDREVTPAMLEVLKKNNVRAAFFVTGKNAEENPEIIKRILAEGHEIGNHSYSHDPVLMLRPSERLRREIFGGLEAVKKFGAVTHAFRPPAGITNPRLWRVLLEGGMFCVNFSNRALDRGNRNIKNISGKILKKIKAGDIILLHDVKPASDDPSLLISEIDKLINGIRGKNLKIVPLSELIERPVMSYSAADLDNPARIFYDGLAKKYDWEQSETAVSIARLKEFELYTSRFEPLIKYDHDILELGAGTGRFTMLMAETAKSITAVDLSPNMLDILRQKAAQKKFSNIETVAADVSEFSFSKKYHAICSFSSLEYISDTASLFKKIYSSLNNGGVLYITTSNRSLFRFFVQIGNAMRQGIWLRARSEKNIRDELIRAGFTDVKTYTHLFKSPLTHGMLLEVIAKK